MSQQAPELVMVINRNELLSRGVDMAGVYPFDIAQLPDNCFGFMPRDLMDNKKSSQYSALATLLPQPIPYVVIRNSEDRYLTYQRKGKEEGILGKYSIGVGGHIDISDRSWAYLRHNYQDHLTADMEVSVEVRPDLLTIARVGLHRELYEELGLNLNGYHPFTHVISSNIDATALGHIGLVQTFDFRDFNNVEVVASECTPTTMSADPELKYDPTEFNNVQWLTKDELIALMADETVEVEPWTQLLITQYL